LLAACHVAAGRVDDRIAPLGGFSAWAILALGVLLVPRWT
jgi:hypothetical protein